MTNANDVMFALGVGDVSVLILLDLSSAFDTINYHILFRRLQSLYGISGTAPFRRLSLTSLIGLRL